MDVLQSAVVFGRKQYSDCRIFGRKRRKNNLPRISCRKIRQSKNAFFRRASQLFYAAGVLWTAWETDLEEERFQIKKRMVCETGGYPAFGQLADRSADFCKPDGRRQLFSDVPTEEWNSYASFRNSPYGYWNLFLPELSYSDFSSYVDSIDRYIQNGSIQSIQELYYPIRLKPAGENSLEHLRNSGVNHIELRMLDLNPMCCAGVARRDLIFIHLLIAYRTAELLRLSSETLWECSADAENRRFHACAVWNGRISERERLTLHRQASRFYFWEENPGFQSCALQLLDAMQDFYTAYEREGMYIPNGYAISDVIEFERQKILHPDQRYANRIRKKYQPDYIGVRMDEIRTG